MGMVYNANVSKNELGAQVEALNIATNVIEELKGMNIEDLTAEKIDIELYEGFYKNNITNGNIDSNNKIYTCVIGEKKDNNGVVDGLNFKASYMVRIVVEDYADGKEDITPNIVKTIHLSITYKYKGEEKTIELSTVVK